MSVCLVDLLLCGHHVRVSQAAPQAADAAVYDRTGLLIMARIRTAAAPGPERLPECQLLHGRLAGVYVPLGGVYSGADPDACAAALRSLLRTWSWPSRFRRAEPGLPGQAGRTCGPPAGSYPG